MALVVCPQKHNSTHNDYAANLFSAIHYFDLRNRESCLDTRFLFAPRSRLKKQIEETEQN